MAIERFEDIQTWQKARELNKIIYGLTSKDKFRKDIALVNQIQRSSVSRIANIAEGFDRQTNKEFIQFLYIASASASELQSHLYVALDLGYIKHDHFEKVHNQAMAVKKLINSFIAYLKKPRGKS